MNEILCPVCRKHNLAKGAWLYHCCCGECGPQKEKDDYECPECGHLREDIVKTLIKREALK